MLKESGEEVETQADRVIAAFKGVNNLIDALKAIGESRDQMVIRRWAYDKHRGGTGGLIPHDSMRLVLAAAEKSGVKLTDRTLSPVERPIKKKGKATAE